MKKTILSVFAFTLIAVASANAQTAANQTSTATVQENKTPVKVEELPEAVKTTLKADAYKEWIPASAQLVKVNGAEHYAIEMKKGSETTTLKVDKEGKPVK